MDISNFIKKALHLGNAKDVDSSTDVLHCSICGAPAGDVNLIIRGGGNTYVCDRCGVMITEQMNRLNEYIEMNKLREELETIEESTSEDDSLQLPTPRDIKEYLDSYVVGQEDAKKKIAIAIYNHYKRIYQPDEDDVTIGKSDILLLGNSGCGKTQLCRAVADLLDVPFTIVDANSFTEAGYVGEDVETILTRLYQSADGDVKKTEMGIVMIDEIDKISKKGENMSITRDVSGEGVQQALLKIIEGTVVKIDPEGGRKHPEKQLVDIDTKNILFICAGAFVGIERVIANRLNTHSIGFSKSSNEKIDKSNMLQYLTAEDVRAYGLIPELVGRLPVITYVNKLTKEEMKRILIEPENAIVKQYKKMFAMDGVQLVFRDDALDYIVEQSMKMNVGARALRSVIEEVMTDYMYEVPGSDKKRVTITKKAAQTAYEKKHKMISNAK